MRGFIAFVVIGYLIGVVVALAPTFHAKLHAPTSEFATAVLRALPNAILWPERIFYRISGR